MQWIRTESHAYWFLTVVFFLAIGTWETFRPNRDLTVAAGRRWRNHGLMLAIAAVCNTLLLHVSPVALSLIVANSRFGVLNRPGLPMALRWAIAIAFLDLTHYWIHRSYHLFPWLWRVHQVHHSDPDYDVSTAARFHPVETVITASVILGVIALLAPPPFAVLTSELMTLALNLAVHANASLPAWGENALRLAFFTPDLHRIHHSEDIRDQQRNMGVMFPWWDRLFGTYTPAVSSGKAIFKTGLMGMEHRDGLSLGFMLAEPFLHVQQEGPNMRPDPLS